MSNRLFQGVIHQMKDAIDRTVGVVDETGTIISCSELGRIGEVQESSLSDVFSGRLPVPANCPYCIYCIIVTIQQSTILRSVFHIFYSLLLAAPRLSI